MPTVLVVDDSASDRDLAGRVLEEDARLAVEYATDGEDALAKIKTLRGLLPICTSCKSIRDDQGYWRQIETYFHDHSDAGFSHSICPDCYETKVKPELESFQAELDANKSQKS